MRVCLLAAGLLLMLVSRLGQEKKIQQAQALWSDGIARIQRCDAAWGSAVVPSGEGRWG
jgi:hypothetical protein